MLIHQCADRANCGEIFRAYPDSKAATLICPYCGENATQIEYDG